ncbi:chitin deacetylase, carbohydrate esterase family 4 protein [Pseudohyphozyma bogoriensis]|nr:chitin deacetylase, carbohydrate esterase family 4 protein [Pseudohyphozyma bogoriensis]
MMIPLLPFLLLLGSASAVQVPFDRHRPTSAEQPHAKLNTSSVANLIFASFQGIMRQTPNTLFPNGHSVTLGTIPQHTLLYHARKDAHPPPKQEWLAFDSEMSYGIMAGRGGTTFLLTYAAARPLRVLVLDGQSAALGETGWLDSQSVLMYGNVTGSDGSGGPFGRWAGQEYERVRGLCELGGEWGFDGVVRMNAGFEVICLISHLNVTDPFNPDGFGFPAPPDSPDRAISLLAERSFDASPPPKRPDGPDFPRGPPGGPRGNGSWPGRGRGPGGPRFPVSPFASTATWEWKRSATWHCDSAGESRVKIDARSFVTFYDPSLTSLMAKREKDDTLTKRDKQRLLGISSKDAEVVRRRVKDALEAKNQRGWTNDDESTSDLRGVADTIVERFSGRLGELRWLVEANSTVTGNATARATSVRQLTYALLMPFLDMSNFSSTETAWLAPTLPRCSRSFINSLGEKGAGVEGKKTRGEELVIVSIEGVMERLCGTLVNVFGESLLLGLPLTEDEKPTMEMENNSKVILRTWEKDIVGLMDWLGWGVWLRCDRVCEWNEICALPFWPLGGFGRGRGGDETIRPTLYGYAPVTDVIDTYPAIWVTANLSQSGILDSDKAIYTAMEAGIPDIAPRGTRAGNFSGVNYNSTDPYCWWSWDKCTTPKLAGLQDDITRCPEPNTWGFTLDDGPNCSHNAVNSGSYYDYLSSIEQKATLFYIGSNVLDWPLEAQRGLDDGHEICAHTWSHPYMTSMTNEEAFAELYYSKKALQQVLGITVRCWRPPYGDVDDRIRYIAEKLDLRTVVWLDDTDDWDYAVVGIPAVEANYQTFIAQGANGTFANEGTIVLTHELNNETMSLSEKYLPSIRSTFTGGVMPVAVCMNNTQPYVEQNNSYVYPNYAQWAAGTRTISLVSATAASTSISVPLSGISTASGAVATSTGAAVAAVTTSSASAASTGASVTASAASAAKTAGAGQLAAGGWGLGVAGGLVLANGLF